MPSDSFAFTHLSGKSLRCPQFQPLPYSDVIEGVIHQSLHNQARQERTIGGNSGANRSNLYPSRCIINAQAVKSCNSRERDRCAPLAARNLSPVCFVYPWPRPTKLNSVFIFPIEITRNRLSTRKSSVSRLAGGITEKNLVKRRNAAVPHTPVF